MSVIRSPLEQANSVDLLPFWAIHVLSAEYRLYRQSPPYSPPAVNDSPPLESRAQKSLSQLPNEQENILLFGRKADPTLNFPLWHKILTPTGSAFVVTKLQHAIAASEAYLRDHPDATVVEAIEALWDSFTLDQNDILPHKQIWFPDDTQEKIQRAIIHQVSVTMFARPSHSAEGLSRSRR